MYEIITSNLIKICNETERRLVDFPIARDLRITFDMFEEEFYWTNEDGDLLTAASQQSVISVLGSQFGQSSS